MGKLIDRPMTAAEYEQAAMEYFKTLPLEHFMEAIPHSTQRKIALESLDVLHVRRPDVQVFSELLVQYLLREIDRLQSEYKKEKKKATQEKRRAEQEKQRAEQEKQRAEQEKQQRLAAEAEVARLRALLEQRDKPPLSP